MAGAVVVVCQARADAIAGGTANRTLLRVRRAQCAVAPVSRGAARGTVGMMARTPWLNQNVLWPLSHTLVPFVQGAFLASIAPVGGCLPPLYSGNSASIELRAGGIIIELCPAASAGSMINRNSAGTAVIARGYRELLPCNSSRARARGGGARAAARGGARRCGRAAARGGGAGGGARRGAARRRGGRRRGRHAPKGSDAMVAINR
jgi:hypothetical protein